jgi:hypothetical protein
MIGVKPVRAALRYSYHFFYLIYALIVTDDASKCKQKRKNFSNFRKVPEREAPVSPGGSPCPAEAGVRQSG